MRRRRVRTGDRRGWGEDTDVVADTGVTEVEQTVEDLHGQAAESPPADSPVETETARVAPTERRAWSMPKSPVTRKQADAWGRIALKAGVGIARFAARVARYGAGVVEQLWVAIGRVPAALRLLFVVGVLVLLGVVGSIASDSAVAAVCAVVVVPVCGIAFGALGYRWSCGLRDEQPQRTDVPAAEVATSEHDRTLEYVDKKLASALNAFGIERHQQAVIALFQAKTAVELALGTEQDSTSDVATLFPAGDQHLRQRIRAGSTPNLPLQEGNSLAAS
jgi:hypothetical protein